MAQPAVVQAAEGRTLQPAAFIGRHVGRHCRDGAVAALADGFDKTRFRARIAQRSAQLGDGFVHRVVAQFDVAPTGLQQLFCRDNGTGVTA
jgi:hypothetical protein